MGNLAPELLYIWGSPISEEEARSDMTVVGAVALAVCVIVGDASIALCRQHSRWCTSDRSAIQEGQWMG